MTRNDFLKGAGLLGLGLSLPGSIARSRTSNTAAADCVLIPQETEGPYPLDLSKDASKFRQDITDGYPGVQLDLTMKIINVNDQCNPIPNVRVDVWHCNKDGYYSGFSHGGYLGEQDNSGKRFCRGIQITDATGEVKFKTIYPGWYPPRIEHIHFQVFLNSVLKATSQFAFPVEINNEVTAHPLYAEHPETSDHLKNNLSDGVFANGVQYQVASVTKNNATGAYEASITVGISVPASGVINLKPETGGEFVLHQSYPNPARGSASIGFSLERASQVSMEIFDVMGKSVAKPLSDNLAAGSHSVPLDVARVLQLGAGNYVYQLTVTNANGTFRQAKVMTVK
jgi:protocatechuate 3,4-dioxygenase beta subunit